MKKLIVLLVIYAFYNSACTHPAAKNYIEADDERAFRQASLRSNEISKSLFTSEEATISEEDIQRLLDGEIQLPQDAKVAVYMLPTYPSSYHFFGHNAHHHLTNSLTSSFSEKIKSYDGVEQISILPSVLIPRKPSITTLREAAVRMQADLLVIIHVKSDLYHRVKVFTKNEAKAFANTEMLVMDIRTGLIPVTCVSTEEEVMKKPDHSFNQNEFVNTVLRAAMSKSIDTATSCIVSILEELK